MPSNCGRAKSVSLSKPSRSSSLCSHRTGRRAQRETFSHHPRELAVRGRGRGAAGLCWCPGVCPHTRSVLGWAGEREEQHTAGPRPARDPRDAPSPFSAPRSTSCSCPAGCSAGATMQQAGLRAPPPVPLQPCPLWGTPALALACLDCSHGARSCCLVAVWPRRHPY